MARCVGAGLIQDRVLPASVKSIRGPIYMFRTSHISVRQVCAGIVTGAVLAALSGCTSTPDDSTTKRTESQQQLDKNADVSPGDSQPLAFDDPLRQRNVAQAAGVLEQDQPVAFETGETPKPSEAGEATSPNMASAAASQESEPDISAQTLPSGFTRAKRVSSTSYAPLASRAQPLLTSSPSTAAKVDLSTIEGGDGENDADKKADFLAPIYASAPGLGRLAPNGLRTQTSTVDVACLRPKLVRILKQVEAHFGQKVLVTSGYRSPARNRAVRGARNSFHLYCAAADIQVPGVARDRLAAYLRSFPGRGGVGTYCHTRSVHIDIGPKRQWNWGC